MDQQIFETMYRADQMASDKLTEGIEGFSKALLSFEELLAARLTTIER